MKRREFLKNGAAAGSAGGAAGRTGVRAGRRDARDPGRQRAGERAAQGHPREGGGGQDQRRTIPVVDRRGVAPRRPRRHRALQPDDEPLHLLARPGARRARRPGAVHRARPKKNPQRLAGGGHVQAGFPRARRQGVRHSHHVGLRQRALQHQGCAGRQGPGHAVLGPDLRRQVRRPHRLAGRLAAHAARRGPLPRPQAARADERAGTRRGRQVHDREEEERAHDLDELRAVLEPPRHRRGRDHLRPDPGALRPAAEGPADHKRMVQGRRALLRAAGLHPEGFVQPGRGARDDQRHARPGLCEPDVAGVRLSLHVEARRAGHAPRRAHEVGLRHPRRLDEERAACMPQDLNRWLEVWTRIKAS